LSDTVRSEFEDGVTTIVLDRPSQNLLDTATATAYLEQLESAAAAESVEAIVLRGAGGAFCGGTDLEKIRGGEDPVQFARLIVDTFKLLPRLTKPVIAAVDGDALMGGFGLACACDVVVATKQARIGTIEASMQLWPMIAQVPALRRLPTRLVVENVITGQPWSGQRAAELGIVNVAVGESEFEAELARWVKRVRSAGQAIASGRPLMYGLLDMGYDEGLDEALSAFASMFQAS
jgi:enoyl-CoA hydratase/carnithine racemase